MTRPDAISRQGTVLVFVLAAMTIVTVMASALVKNSEAPDAVAVARETQVIADSMALSGLEMMFTLDDNKRAGDAVNYGHQFLVDRERRLSVARYPISTIFQMPSKTAAINYTPPIEYPPIKHVNVRAVPALKPPREIDNDIRLPNASISAGFYNLGNVPNTGAASPAIEGSVLPRNRYYIPDTNAVGLGLYSTANGKGLAADSDIGLRILALEPDASVNHAISWIGPQNTAASDPYLPNATYIQGVNDDAANGGNKMPTPSVIFIREAADTPRGASSVIAYAYCWYVKKQTSPDEWQYMTSGRVRYLYGGGTEIGSEVAVSPTQIR